MTEDDYRAAVKDQYEFDLGEASVALLKACARIGQLGDRVIVLGADAVLDSCEGDALPDEDSTVELWNALVSLRHELNAAQRHWRDVDRTAQGWSAIHFKPHFNASTRIADQEDDR
jgi:hypothetical protein